MSRISINAKTEIVLVYMCMTLRFTVFPEKLIVISSEWDIKRTMDSIDT
jgi:hypothetical protein